MLVRHALCSGVVIPAHPLALNAARQLDERRQRALSRYYIAAGAGGLAVGVHTTQFRIHDPKVGLLKPVWTLAAEEMDRGDAARDMPLVRVAGICGETRQAVSEAHLARDLRFQFGLLSLGKLPGASIPRLLDHCRVVAEIIPLFGFYLQPKAGGVELPHEFWHGFCEIENVAAIKIAAFDRYRTLDVIRAVVESGRDDIALYTGNDDNIVFDLISPYRFDVGKSAADRCFVGGLLGQWAVWTSQAVALHRRCRDLAMAQDEVPSDLLRLAVELTDANGAIFDAANDFRGCIPGIHEVLRRQGLLSGGWCLNEDEVLSAGQAAEISRVSSAYPHLADDEFVAQNLDSWLSG
ncbi:MAG: dihydrodipicolinate synthase family protein [Planctomycetes bacterium]|nr:dihydrodipicolinate synthase family protein [Planctomycetota bacterium]